MSHPLGPRVLPTWLATEVASPPHAERVAQLEASFGAQLMEQARRYLARNPGARAAFEAGDIVNGVWASVLGAHARSGEANPIREEPLHYLRRSMTNYVKNLARTQHRRMQPFTKNVPIPDEGLEAAPRAVQERLVDRAGEAQHIARERQELLRRGVDSLPPDSQRPLRMWLDGHSNEEIAAALGVTPAATKSRLTRARAQLRAFIGEHQKLR